MKTLGLTLLIGFAGYLVGVMLGMLVVNVLSPNQHDKSVEAAMTSFFIIGPAVALLAAGSFLLVRLLTR